MATNNIDTDISNYTLTELMAISDINDLNKNEIIKKTTQKINKFKNTNPKLSSFFYSIQCELLQYADKMNSSEGKNTYYTKLDNQTKEWYENEVLKQKDEVQNNKITDRKQKIDVFGDYHVPMKKEQLGVNDTFNVSVKQDTLNPNLKNTITRFVNLDSQFRQYTNGVESTSTDYTLDLSDTLSNVLSMRLYSYQIPYTWYTIDSNLGNTCLWISDGSYNVCVTIPPGNYTPSQFQTTLNQSFTDAGFTSFPTGSAVSYNQNNGKLTLKLYGGIFNGLIDGVSVSFTITENTIIIFYDFTGNLKCYTNCVNKSYYLNQTLGWLMGYRSPYISVDINGNLAPAVLDLSGTKYLILVIDDYNQNHVNNSLVSITELSNILKLPNYYSPDLPQTCISPAQQANNLQNLINVSNNGLLIAGKYEHDYTSTQIVLPSAPRTLTQSQIYTINEINKNRNNLTNYKAKAPTSSDILAIIPIKTSGLSVGNVIVELSGSLQDNIRTYFGPVNIERMNVKLLDDKGNIINLNGGDWCITLICECLYQY